MIGEDRDDPGDAKGNRPASLVERAARKVVIDHRRSLTGDAETQAAAPRPVEGGAMRAAQPADLQDAPAGAVGYGPDGEQGEQRRRSKSVKVDIGGLASRNLLTPQSKRNRTVEEFRLIKRRVLSRRWVNGEALGNTVMVTSALPEEGKTTVSINLAMSIAAEEDLRVLLVDADFIKPDALRRLGVSAEKGLIDVIEDPRMDIADVMLKTDIDKLSLIPSGRLHDRCTELLASDRMNELIAELASRYHDRILIFDSPPVLATTESVTLASHMGQIVFVVQAERTRRQLVDSALELLGNMDKVGLVLNRATPKIGSTEFGYHYDSYYYQSEAREKA